MKTNKENLATLSSGLNELSQIECLIKYQNFINPLTIKAIIDNGYSLENSELDGLYIVNEFIENKINTLNSMSELYKNMQN